MKLRVNCQIDYQCAENVPLILMLRPQTGAAQQVLQESLSFNPETHFTEFQDNYGNLNQKLITPIGNFKIEASAVVLTSDSIDVNFAAGAVAPQFIPDYAQVYILPSRYCESDLFLQMAAEITQDFQTGYEKANAICQWVKNNITYQYGFSSSSTSAVDINQTRIGVCRDFSHLAIALSRAINLPARMVVGYLYELDPMDMHAWYEVYLENQWFTFDATQAQAKGNRVVLAYGRDASDVAFATQFGNIYLNNMQVSVEAVS
ncbi:transglutaminase family protein [Emticicia sp. W12TSBA100-4]|uniref:transglutaminase family protein n=1 Tax=Emticicia sp. W12TSBA100-4 TaxID=3160965 RepID=UPI0033061C67